jgi:hypothetical protein
MGRSAARGMVALLLVAFALGAGRLAGGPTPASAVEASPAVPQVVAGEVLADGAADVPDPAWISGRYDDGRYVVVVAGRDELAITGWDAVAEVVTTPFGGGVWAVAFVGADGALVETGFAFEAR